MSLALFHGAPAGTTETLFDKQINLSLKGLIWESS